MREDNPVPDPRPLPAVLLAAGAGVRLGGPKALLDVRGRPAVAHLIDVLRLGGATPIHVVVGAAADAVTPVVEGAGAVAIRCPDWAAGRTASLQAGLRALPDSAPAALLALVDMPLIRTDTIAALVAAWHAASPETDLIVPEREDRRGHPIVLGRSLFGRIATLGPDAPLRDLLRAARRQVVSVDDPGVLIDLDTPEDLLRHGLDAPSRDR